MIRTGCKNVFVSYVVVQVKGPQLEHFLNACRHHGFRLWDVERIGPGHLIACTDPETFRRMRFLGRRGGWQLRIVAKQGGGFFISRLRRRSAFLFGSLAALVIWYVLSVHVWFVHVEGNEVVTAAEVLAVARQAGLGVGVHKDAVEVEHVQRQLLLHVDQLVWAGIEVRGTRALIRVAERRQADEFVQGPGNIVAARDGVVDRITVFEGVPVVEPGDTVRAGQVLISGLLPPGSPEFNAKVAAGEIPYIRAAGIVHAMVWHETSATVAVDEGSVDVARSRAVDVAWALALDWLAAARAEQLGEPLIEIDTETDPQHVTARVVIQAIQDIATFEAVVP